MPPSWQQHDESSSSRALCYKWVGVRERSLWAMKRNQKWGANDGRDERAANEGVVFSAGVSGDKSLEKSDKSGPASLFSGCSAGPWQQLRLSYASVPGF